MEFLYLKNKSIIRFQTFDDPNQARGQGLNWLWIDEACELTRKHWDVIRPSLMGDTVTFLTTSPQGRDWVYKEFYKKAEDNIPGYWACQAKTSETGNPAFTKEYLDRERETMSEEEYLREYEASFVTFEGAVYGDKIFKQILPESSMKAHIPEWPNINADRQVYFGIDTGADHPTGGLKVVATPNGLYVTDEYLQRDRSYVEHFEDMKMMVGSNPVRWCINKNERQAMIEMSQHGVHAVGAENDQLNGIERVKTWLQSRKLWFVGERVPKTIEQMSSLHWLPEKPDGQHRDKPMVFKKDDELADCCRYVLMTFPLLPAQIEEKKERDISNFSDDTQRHIHMMRRYNKKLEEQNEIADDFWG